MQKFIRLAAAALNYASVLKAKKNLKILLDGEEVLRQAEIKWQANNIFPVDGVLQLTNLRLRFLSSGDDYVSYPLADVIAITFKNYLGILPQGIRVEYADGRTELFGVTKREQWVNEILTAKAKAGSFFEPERTADGAILDADDVAIRQRLSNNFNLEELKTLCFDLGVDFDNLPGVTKDEKARELVVTLGRSGGLQHLLKRGQELRPHVVWY